jgi:hypothetical protein
LRPPPTNPVNQTTASSSTADVSTPSMEQRLAQIAEQLTDLHRDLNARSLSEP